MKQKKNGGKRLLNLFKCNIGFEEGAHQTLPFIQSDVQSTNFSLKKWGMTALVFSFKYLNIKYFYNIKYNK